MNVGVVEGRHWLVTSVESMILRLMEHGLMLRAKGWAAVLDLPLSTRKMIQADYE
jgi:hypothetical protein